MHPNILTLHRVLETSAFLLLLLEFVPGHDLLYFLEERRDLDSVDLSSDSARASTPPTPGLLSLLNQSHLLSHARLCLIASMFEQMCEAVATCHEASVFHRDIKPENFIVTDGCAWNPDGICEHKVITKLCDFSLSTRDAISPDMNYGCAPYMSYGMLLFSISYFSFILSSYHFTECRNNMAPEYKPRGADVWSLGIVLISM